MKFYLGKTCFLFYISRLIVLKLDARQKCRYTGDESEIRAKVAAN